MKILPFLSVFLLFYILSPVAGYAQATRTVAGTIYSASTKQPMPGVSITSKTTGQVLVSGNGGAFTFSGLSDADTLVFASIGYVTRAIPLSGIEQGPLDVYLEESISLIDEVQVNTGYQSLPKERATGSFTQIDNDLFNRSVSTDLISRLEGVTSGLSYELPRTTGEPSSTPNLRVRGLSTINGESEPLIVVDNFPYEGDINNINPNDVESITVLKDAAASSIWGSRAGNGVIVITTKSGLTSRRPTIHINSNVSISDRPDLYYSRDFLPPAEAIELEGVLFDKGLYVQNDWTAYTPVVEIRYALDEKKINEATANHMLDELKQYDVRAAATEKLYRQSINQQYAMNMSGGSEKHHYYLSAGFDDNAMQLIGNNFERLTLSAKNDFQPLPKLSISTSINYMQSRSSTNGISLGDLSPAGMVNIYSYARLADENGAALPIVRNNRITYTENAQQMGLLDWHYRPLDELGTNDNTSGTKEVRLNAALRYLLFRNLQVEARYQYQDIGSNTRRHYTQDSYFARNEINRFTQADGARPVPLGGMLDRGGSAFQSHYGRLQIDFDKRWAGRHELNGLAGFELRQDRNTNIGGSRLYGYNDEVLTHATGLDFASSFPTRPRFSGIVPYLNAPGRQTIDRFVSYYANVGYTYDSRYILSASTRWDASNIFGVAFNQKGVPLWSVGGAWNASNELFLAADWINFAKLRVTYGSNGNAIRSLSSLPFINYQSMNPITSLPMGILSSVGNPNLSWEQVSTINLGLDFAVLNRRLSGSVEWYNKNSSNLIGNDLFDPTTGIIPTSGGFYNLDTRRNYADLNTKGIDIELNTLNVDRSVKWQTSFLFSKVKNAVTNHHTPQGIQTINYFGAELIPVVKGVSRDQLYALPWHGLDDTGSPLVLVDGALGTEYNAYFNSLAYEDLLKAGVSVPPYFGAIRNTFSWRSLSVSVNLLWKAGYNFRRSTINYNSLFGTGLTNIDYLNRWRNPGDELTTNVPAMPETTDLRRDQAYIFSEATMEKGDHIRLQDISLSYQLPQQYISGAGIAEVRLYAYARNLGLLWKRTDYDIDPDARALYPQPLQLSFGLQIKL
ncbi:SusC/RagA family TonB-linked outer membrane protein [Parapedobacter pyrenivorans]|uniref:SusC/RagA family TonB-linked outer membrane protein n=1 Tax=Parapedobacter pyrenivorans TaxID=1305674 RepID=A0A917MF65_9SPHI|nr:SusC/RagA family TonB-linked outer membrane protein [Parapedobacter pyrenivorans]GGH01479.1 SusC/RagA family TonB-linked outer membrane protein [Parapedobacter pyrenivorans]